MKIIPILNKVEIEAFYRQNTLLNLYQIGDLDSFFFQKTKWFELKKNEETKAILLLYQDKTAPILLALNYKNFNTEGLDIKQLSPILPQQFYAHLTPDFKNILEQKYDLVSHGKHYKMGLTDKTLLQPKKDIETESWDFLKLSHAHQTQIQHLFQISYPDNWFNEQMLNTGQYYGLFDNGTLIGIGGVHVYSKTYKVAALGNITIHPEYRNKGLGTRLVQHICLQLLQNVQDIGLNVAVDNIAAIESYKNAGFEILGEYEEFMVSLT